jgi:hypothetical protein
MRDDIILNKSETIKRCIARINEEYEGKPENLNDFHKQARKILKSWKKII